MASINGNLNKIDDYFPLLYKLERNSAPEPLRIQQYSLIYWLSLGIYLSWFYVRNILKPVLFSIKVYVLLNTVWKLHYIIYFYGFYSIYFGVMVIILLGILNVLEMLKLRCRFLKCGLLFFIQWVNIGFNFFIFVAHIDIFCEIASENSGEKPSGYSSEFYISFRNWYSSL